MRLRFNPNFANFATLCKPRLFAKLAKLAKLAKFANKFL